MPRRRRGDPDHRDHHRDVVALVVGAVLTQGDGSLRATVALRQVAGTTYAADGAAQIAINDLRTGVGFAGNPTEGGFNNSLDGSGCFGFNGANPASTLTLNGFYPRTGSQAGPSSAAVECAGVDGTGMQGSPVPINNTNKPGYAIVTLNGPLTTADTLKVHGDVYSNSSISGPVSLDAGDAWAFGACSQTTVVAPGTKHCNSGAKVPDPNYGNDLGGSVPALQTPPTSCTGGVAVFQPGYYDNAATLTTATGLCSTAWFKPGTYYFDFHNDSCANVCPSNLYGTGGNVWTINGGNVVGGTPINASGATISAPTANPTYPGACRSPVSDVNAVGVQFVFGGSSRMYVDQNSHVELCGSYSASKPPIEIYGLKTGSTPAAATANGLNVGSVPTPGGFTYAPPATQPHERAGGRCGRQGRHLDDGQQQQQPVDHDHDGRFRPWLGGTGGLGPHRCHAARQAPGCRCHRELRWQRQGDHRRQHDRCPGRAAVGDDDDHRRRDHGRQPERAADGDPCQRLHGRHSRLHGQCEEGRRRLLARPAQPRPDLLRPGAARPGRHLHRQHGGSCTFLSMKNGNNKILLYLQGTTYVPYADANIQLGNFSAEVAKFGFVARQLEFSITNGNPSWTGPIFEIPDNSPGYGYENTTVDLKVHLCPGVATCSVSDPVSLTARVQLWDPTGTPIPNQRQVSVLSWSHQR